MRFAYVVTRDEDKPGDPPIGARVQVVEYSAMPLILLTDGSVWPMPAAYLVAEPKHQYSPAAHARLSTPRSEVGRGS